MEESQGGRGELRCWSSARQGVETLHRGSSGPPPPICYKLSGHPCAGARGASLRWGLWTSGAARARREGDVGPEEVDEEEAEAEGGEPQKCEAATEAVVFRVVFLCCFCFLAAPRERLSRASTPKSINRSYKLAAERF